MVSAGEMTAFETDATDGRITTCESGSGATARLVDNITNVSSASGAILNFAGDGSANDVAIAASHPASQAWAGVSASSVVIDELDTPVVTALVASGAQLSGAQFLSPLVCATEPAAKAVTERQVDATGAAATLDVNGAAYASGRPPRRPRSPRPSWTRARARRRRSPSGGAAATAGATGRASPLTWRPGPSHRRRRRPPSMRPVRGPPTTRPSPRRR